jgi:superfamily II RNA helicase
MKAAGVEYEERIEALDKLEYPKPLREWTYELFDDYRLVHPWAADYNIQPKSVARDLYERAMTFSEYIAHYGLTRSEGLLLRYLSDVYRGLIRNVPEELKTEELLDVTEWLGELVRQVDSSLIDEWEHLAAAAASTSLEEAVAEIGLELGEEATAPPVSANSRAFKVMVRNAAFRRAELFARRDAAALAEAEAAGGLDATGWSEALERYYSVHPSLATGPEARSRALFDVVEHPGRWLVRQVLDDPEGWHDTAIIAEIDIASSDEAGSPEWRTLRLQQG